MSDKQTKLEQRIDDLEYQIAYQEQTIDSLNNALAQQQLQMSKMQEQMQFMIGKLKTMTSSNLADPSEETPPPHY
ncbi:SlyX family protein [Vibrio sp.]|nr:SlyX family protein [Vibrio sp.]